MKVKKHRGIRAATSTLLSLVMAVALLGAIPLPALADDGSEAEALPSALDDELVFQLDILVPSNGSVFNLPVSSLQEPRPLFNWVIDWGDGNQQIAIGSATRFGGIPHVYSFAGLHSITIKPNGSIEAWLAAFGFGPPNVIMLEAGSTEDLNSASMVFSVPTPIRPGMTRTQSQAYGIATPPDNEWAYAFWNCYRMYLAPSFVGWEGVKAVGNNFARSMFEYCASLSVMPAGYNLPQDFEVSGGNFADYMFYKAGGLYFQINDEFRFPQRLSSQNIGNFCQTFWLSDNAPVQNRTAASIIGSCPAPASYAMTFDSHFSDRPFILVNWGGGGLTPRSGDLNGDGFVTMDEVNFCARVAISDIIPSPVQLAILDIDGDGVITMADIMLIFKLSIL